ncbi:hypothetical protein PHYPSEUDO_003761 [Phytophthora pseudosyringae]|uniref:EF-hand domain-containing protein n=1 Tax=Phytophthora pseudosyringae TaxID=221518 RepID=A0A8T1WD99_9STRA|nr:hypothetical protein PHYPSEUDO_003761 [Phytophthora pseudosyringae]
MRISENSHHLKKTSLWDNNTQAEANAKLTTPDILSKATATIRATLGVNNPQDIWSAFGRHLQKQFVQHNAVSITDFGAFGFGEDDEPSFVQDPVFLHMTRLCLASRKRGNSVQPALSQPEKVVSIDLNEFAAEYLQNCSKDLVNSVISSVLAWVVAWAKDGQEMRLSFLPIGEWICSGDSVDFRFSESFRKELKLQKAVEAANNAELATDGDRSINNQIEDQDQTGDHSTIAPLSPRTIAGFIETLNSGLTKAELDVETSLSAAKEAATRNGSPVSRSRYKLRASTFSSIAKQLPPHGQRLIGVDTVVTGPTSNSKTKTTPGKKHGKSRSTRGSAPPRFNLAEIEAAAKEIIAAVNTSRPTTASTSRACKNNQRAAAASQPTAQQMETINRLLKRISNRRSKTMQGLNAVVAVLNPFKTGAISSTELSLSLRKLGVKISSAELKEIAAAFAHEKRGYIDIHKLLDALRGPPLSEARFNVVARVFHQMDPACSGAVHIDEMIKHYNVGFLPQVRDGKQSRLEALTAFLQEWACINTATANTITLETFAEYYHNVSACIGSDAEFAWLMDQAWHIREENQESENKPRVGGSSSNVSTTTSAVASEGPSPTTGNVPERLLQEEISPSEAWSYLRALLLFPPQYQNGVHSWPTLDNMCRRLGANRVLGDGNETMNVKAFAHELLLLDKQLPHKKAYELSRFVAANCGNGQRDNDTIVLLSLYRQLMTSPNEVLSSTEASVDYNYVEYYASRAIERIRAHVKGPQTSDDNAESSSLVDLNTLEQWLQVFSSTGDALLLKYELRGALLKLGIDVTYQDLDYLFAYFDEDHQGFINYEAFLEALRSSSRALPKRSKQLEKPVTTPEPPTSARVRPLAKWPTAQSDHRRKQVASREPQPNYRRRNLIHRAIWGQPTRPTATDASGNLDKLEIERRRRYGAARMIQTVFRAFRARQIVAQLRRKATATNDRCNALAQEQQQWLANRNKTYRYRTALPTAYGF